MLFYLLFLHRTDCIPRFVQLHRIKIRSLRFQLGIFSQSVIQFNGIFLLPRLQLFQTGLHGGNIPAELRSDWAAFLFAQVCYGTLWAGLFTVGEWTFSTPQIHWGMPLVAALLFVAIGPAVVAYRCWGLGVQRVGPDIAVFFVNLTPLFAALLSLAFLGEPPRLYHALAFVLIVGGILLSSRRG